MEVCSKEISFVLNYFLVMTRAKETKQMKKAYDRSESAKSPELIIKPAVKNGSYLPVGVPIGSQPQQVEMAEHKSSKPQTPQQQQRGMVGIDIPEVNSHAQNNPNPYYRKPIAIEIKPAGTSDDRLETFEAEGLVQKPRSDEPGLKKRYLKRGQHTGYAFSQLEREDFDDLRRYYQN